MVERPLFDDRSMNTSSDILLRGKTQHWRRLEVTFFTAAHLHLFVVNQVAEVV